MSEFTGAQDAEIRRVLQARQPGGVLAGTPTGPVLDNFDPRELADAIEDELIRCGERGWNKITLHMDVRDALLLARFLRRGQGR